MKKLFISCPMRGRTDANIEYTIDRLHKIAEAYVGEKLEVIESYRANVDIPEGASETEKKLIYLGRSIMYLGQADVVIGCCYYDSVWPGCEVEMRAAEVYNLRVINIPDRVMYEMFPDMLEIMHKRWTGETACSVDPRKD